MSKKLIK